MFVQIILLVGVILLAYIFFKAIKNSSLFIINSIIGLFALIGFNFLFGSEVAINIWSILITAIGGVLGFLIVLIAHFMGLAF